MALQGARSSMAYFSNVRNSTLLQGPLKKYPGGMLAPKDATVVEGAHHTHPLHLTGMLIELPVQCPVY